jgi:hypothetical protein
VACERIQLLGGVVYAQICDQVIKVRERTVCVVRSAARESTTVIMCECVTAVELQGAW